VSRIRPLIVLVVMLSLLSAASPTLATHGTRTAVYNMENLGDLLEPVDPFAPGPARTDHTDLAFWGNLLINGNYNGFKLIDISDPANPAEVANYKQCNGNQGDVLVWDNLVVRSWNSPAPNPDGPTGRTCGGAPVPQGFEGLHIFDISDPDHIELIRAVEMSVAGPSRVPPEAAGLGSHTATLVPDLENGRVLVYNSASSGAHPGIDIVEIPLDEPAAASVLRFVPAGRSCHDTQVYLDVDRKRAACAGGNGYTMFSMDAADGGSLEHPVQLYSVASPLGASGHSSAFSWDGSVLVFGTEPGGGVQARCQESTPEIERTMFFFDADTGEHIGGWVLERTQGPTENCTIHNFNVIPTRNQRDVVVSGNYQAGTWVTDFTDPGNAYAIGWSDPPPIDPDRLIDGGAWSSYWYNGYIYESDIYTGLHVFRPTAREAQTAVRFPFLNPQTQIVHRCLGGGGGREHVIKCSPKGLNP
jgi:hypothetical protein